MSAAIFKISDDRAQISYPEQVVSNHMARVARGVVGGHLMAPTSGGLSLIASPWAVWVLPCASIGDRADPQDWRSCQISHGRRTSTMMPSAASRNTVDTQCAAMRQSEESERQAGRLPEATAIDLPRIPVRQRGA